MIMRQRDALRPLFLATWDALSRQFNAAELENWAGAVLELVNVNAGPACLIAYWEASRTAASAREIAPLLGAAQIGAEICRHAGAAAATASLNALATARRSFEAAALSRWWRAMEVLARQAPESVQPAASRMGQILLPGTIEAFEDFIAAGLRSAAGDRNRRLAFFSLQDDLARRMIARDPGGVGFPNVEAEVKAFTTALWGELPLLRGMAGDSMDKPQRRSTISGPIIRLPETYRGVRGDAARGLFRAATAHAQAHLVLGRARFPIGTLKPLQVALVNLIEDARVETLAMRALPGLRRLWAPYHVAEPRGIATAPVLLARLARALFDPAHVDDDGFVAKGRALFAAALPRIEDSAISREIGTLLGNDLGQMRVQFNARTYVVEPVYRDDGLGLWDFGADAQPPDDVLDLFIDAMRVDSQESADGSNQRAEPGNAEAGIARGRPVAPDDRGTVIARYPEWDRVHGIERPDWTVVREVAAKTADPHTIDEALDRSGAVRNRVARLVRGLRIGRTVRLKRQHDGHDLDVDAMLDAGIALRSGREPDPRVFRSSKSVHRDLSALLLIDTSHSTSDRLLSGSTVLDVERLAVAILSEAMDRLGDPFGLLSFASDGREDVRMTVIKGFDEAYDRHCRARLAGLSSGLSTRLGTALRHAGNVMATASTSRRLLIVLTDGEPSDIDVADPLDLVEDARRAAVDLHRRGIDAYGVVLGTAGIASAPRIFGRGNTMLVPRVENLPARLSELYFRLARR
ncbi:von Willebrand factor type A domain-containing protein [Bradyrhizobium sp. R2.2-H]|uniref:nitric oxide reductase activation protein NorD n=1 Tax=unclassified Bradyrhizobium TaxID=2631580 RepID=UPI0010D383B3|nr:MULTISPECIES: VWA domain-containing protein [unclassified Bradyrhizobium]TCU71495.1 von Willebrand factor type A domain-containing protein [Bradyrhizobium sp. Y-H1]TCU72986.1 von Willebrand factor type A domain-containing protein [Bradyrhizobium sp. R2.2-H]